MKKNFDTIIIKGLMILGMTLVMLLPISMITSIIQERAQSKDEATSDIRSKWGGSQEVSGPILALPYEKTNTITTLTNGIKTETKEKVVGTAYFLPKSMDVDGNLATEERAVSIYKTLLYKSDLNIKGSFSVHDLKALNIKPEEVEWDKAMIILGISHMQGVSDKLAIEFDKKNYEAETGVNRKLPFKSGVTFRVAIDKDKWNEPLAYDMNLKLNGSEDIFIVPVAKENKIRLKADWGGVSFSGDFLATKRDLNTDSFDAEWNIFDYNRNFKQMWIDSNKEEMPSLGVSFKFSVEQYQMAMRAVKYAIMFIALTFVVFFLVEILTRRRIHPIQYLLVSLGLIIFYSLLISLSEHINFDIAYLISAIAIVAMIAGYSHTIFKNKKHTFAMGAFILMLYVYLYVILQLETMALLIGSIGLFAVLACVMYASRKVDWYKLNHDEEDESEDEILTINTNNDENNI